MKDERVKTVLRDRIAQAQQWANEGFPGQITDLQIRHYPCWVVPMEFLDESHRGGRYGVRFTLQWNVERSDIYEAQFEIRINPDRKGGPAVSYFIMKDMTNMESENITWYKVSDTHVENNNLDTISIQYFFRHLVAYVLKEDFCPKFFEHKHKAERHQ
jgi:hypothetical protein